MSEANKPGEIRQPGFRYAASGLHDGHSFIQGSIVDWGPGFYAQHAQSYPDLERPPQVVNIGWLGGQLILCNGGSCFLPERMAAP